MQGAKCKHLRASGKWRGVRGGEPQKSGLGGSTACLRAEVHKDGQKVNGKGMQWGGDQSIKNEGQVETDKGPEATHTSSAIVRLRQTARGPPEAGMPASCLTMRQMSCEKLPAPRGYFLYPVYCSNIACSER